MPSKEVNPEGGEGKAAEGGKEGHCAGEVHVPVEHCRLDKKSWKPVKLTVSMPK